MAEFKLKATPYLNQIAIHGEAADIWIPHPVGANDHHTGYVPPSRATGQDYSNFVWTRTQTTVLVINSTNDIVTEDFGVIPAGSLAVRLNPNTVKPRRYARVVLTAAGRVDDTLLDVGRTAATSLDALAHPFVSRITGVWQGDTAYSNYSLSANADSTQPFAADSLLWLTGSNPADGMSYGVTYEFHPVYTLGTTGSLSLMGSDNLLMPVTLPLLSIPPGT